MLAAAVKACEVCGNAPVGWPEAVMWAAVALAAAWFFGTAVKHL